MSVFFAEIKADPPEDPISMNINVETKSVVVWTHTHYGRGEPLSPAESLRNVVRSASIALALWPEIKGYMDEDYGFCRFDDPSDLATVGSEPIKTVSEAVRAWWNDYGFGGGYDEEDEHSVAQYKFFSGKGPKGHKIGGFITAEEV